MTLHIIADRTKCQGTGYCTMVSPHHFRLDADNLVVVPDGPIDDADATVVESLLEAETLCPLSALTVKRG